MRWMSACRRSHECGPFRAAGKCAAGVDGRAKSSVDAEAPGAPDGFLAARVARAVGPRAGHDRLAGAELTACSIASCAWPQWPVSPRGSRGERDRLGKVPG